MEFAQVEQTYTYNELLAQKNSLLSEIQIVESSMMSSLLQSVTSTIKNNGSLFISQNNEIYIETGVYNIKVEFTLDKVVFFYSKILNFKQQNSKTDTVIDLSKEAQTKNQTSLLKKQILPFFSKTVIWYPEKQSYDEFYSVYLAKILPTKSLKI